MYETRQIYGRAFSKANMLGEFKYHCGNKLDPPFLFSFPLKHSFPIVICPISATWLCSRQSKMSNSTKRVVLPELNHNLTFYSLPYRIFKHYVIVLPKLLSVPYKRCHFLKMERHALGQRVKYSALISTDIKI